MLSSRAWQSAQRLLVGLSNRTCALATTSRNSPTPLGIKCSRCTTQSHLFTTTSQTSKNDSRFLDSRRDEELTRSLRQAKELFDTSVSLGRRRYTFWLKQEPATNECFVKILEQSNGRGTSIYLGLVDLENFIQSLTEKFDGVTPQNNTAYTQFNSNKFENKVFSFYLNINSFGPFLEIQELYESGFQEGLSSSIYISHENNHLEQFVGCANQVKAHAQQLWKESDTSP